MSYQHNNAHQNNGGYNNRPYIKFDSFYKSKELVVDVCLSIVKMEAEKFVTAGAEFDAGKRFLDLYADIFPVVTRRYNNISAPVVASDRGYEDYDVQATPEDSNRTHSRYNR